MADLAPENVKPAQRKSLSELPLLMPEGIRYNCQGCGRCCSGWAVGLTEQDWLKVKDVDWQSLHPELAGRELFIHREKEFASGISRYPHYTKSRENGTCPFLIDNLCFIHGYLGEENKPGMCKLFPYTFVPTPDGVYVGLCYNSNASVRNIGKLLTEQRDYLDKMWRVNVAQELALTGEASEALRRIAGGEALPLAQDFKVSLTNGMPISWDEYLTLEERLMRLIVHERPANFCDLLLAGEEIIVEAIRLKRAGESISAIDTFEPRTDHWRGMPPSVVENMLFAMLCFRNFVWPEYRKRYRHLWAGTERNPLSDPKILGAAAATLIAGQITLPGAGKIAFKRALKAPVAAFSSEMYDFFCRYVYLRLFSKTYFGPALAGLSVLAGYNNMVASFLSAMIFMKAHAIARGDRELAIKDAYEAYFLLDKELVALSQLPAERASFYDLGFSSPRLFNRLLGTLSASIGATR